MSDITAQSDETPQPPLVAVPTRDATTSQQVETCLRITGSMLPILFLTSRELEGDCVAKQIDGEAQVAASLTFIKACDRLDQILGNEERWTSDRTDDVYESIVATQKAATKGHLEQVETQRLMRSPAWTHRPTVAKAGQEFIAFAGTTNFPGAVLVGHGPTPNAALEDFNKAYERGVTEQLRLNDASMAKLSEAENGPTTPLAEVPEVPSRWQRFIRCIFRRK